MPNDLGIRQGMPHGPQPTQPSQPTTFTFAPQQFASRQQPREVKKNYVFVDEYNRHKRLKVMRACEGCRRRKIKCDAATTNTWPCGACIRLKLTCVRPNGFDENGTAAYEPQADVISLDTDQNGFSQQHPAQLSGLPPQGVLNAPLYLESFQAAMYSHSALAQSDIHYTTMPPSMPMSRPVSAMDRFAPPGNFASPPPPQASYDAVSPGSSSHGTAQPELADLLGSLNVNEAGTAPYLRNKASFKREQPVLDDEDLLPPVPIPRGSGLRLRIPPELMPDDETCLHYFNLFFTHVHPYLPVLSRTLFFHKWNQDRKSISPLVLEAIFAISGRLADEPAQGQQWLALASVQADCFMDTPRLSTLQALLLILKAREAAPKRGYYYRSWMMVVQCVQMGKDLGLDEHLSDHEAGISCGSANQLECHMKTRIWQAIFACETMTGAPQGRTDLAVALDTVDFSVPEFYASDDPDILTSRNFTLFARVIRNVSRMSAVYKGIKKKRDWGIDPAWVKLNPIFNAWLSELPEDLAISFPPDDSAPWITTPFAANMLSYYYLTLILLHRPQLTFLDPTNDAAKWKTHLAICNESAKLICRLQEGIVNAHGLNGLACMLRGYSFTVYCGLSCIVLHLVSMTCPDPDLNADASEYFTRYMRIIEPVMAAWPMPEVQRQIDALREAFSADVSKPFVLKTTLPYNSPRPSHNSANSPPSAESYNSPPPAPHDIHRSMSMDHQLQMAGGYPGQPASPPISNCRGEKGDSPALQSLVMMASQSTPTGMMSPGITMPAHSGWNPTRILQQWNTSFGPPPAPGASSNTSPSAQPPSPQLSQPEIHSIGAISAAHGLDPTPTHMSPQQFAAAAQMPFITPAMWKQSVDTIYVGGAKRTWGDYGAGEPIVKRE